MNGKKKNELLEAYFNQSSDLPPNNESSPKLPHHQFVDHNNNSPMRNRE